MDNVRANIGRPLPWFHEKYPVKQEDIVPGKRIALVGGGPSIKNTVYELMDFQTIIACGSVHDWLQANSPRVPTYCAACDPDPVMANYLRAPDHGTKYLMSSHVNPKVFEALEGYDVTMWHCWPIGTGDQDTRDYMEKHTPKWVAVGGGCTVGLRALVMALMMGYTELHFFGFDSCIGVTDDDHHAYPFTDSTKEFLGDIYNLKIGMGDGMEAREYRVAGYQLAQAEHYKQMLQAFGHLFRPVFHGPGLMTDMQAIIDLEAERLLCRGDEKMTGYIGDGVPDSGRFMMAPDGSVQTGPGDASMLCIFYKRAVHSPIKSAQAGRPIYEDMDYVRIQQPGETTQVVDRPVQDNDQRRWPRQWQDYASGKDQVAEGTPLGLLFPRHPSAIAMLQGIGIMTVEHLANANATAIAAIGMNGQDYVNYAQKYISGATSGAKFHQQQLELEQIKREKDRLEKTVEDMQRQMQQINAGLIAQAGINAHLPGLPRQEAPQPATTMPGGSMPRAPSFGGSQVFDAQTAQINATHPMGPTVEPEKKRGGWPKGKPRKAVA